MPLPRATLFLAALWILLVPPAAADNPDMPDTAAIERILRDALAGNADKPYALVQLRRATLIDVTVIGVESIASGRWRAQLAMVIDYGPAPKGILGYERLRIDEFHLDVARRDGRLVLVRLYRVYGLRKLIRPEDAAVRPPLE